MKPAIADTEIDGAVGMSSRGFDNLFGFLKNKLLFSA